VEIQPLEGSCCMVTDSRIPRQWLLQKPCPMCFRDPVGTNLVRGHPESFCPPPGQ
jgi:hypothetical protein